MFAENTKELSRDSLKKFFNEPLQSHIIKPNPQEIPPQSIIEEKSQEIPQAILSLPVELNEPEIDYEKDKIEDVLEEEDEEEEEEEDITPDTVINVNKKYIYLDDNKLSQTFGDFMDTTNPYTIFICMYKINTECVKPFLEFLLDISPEKASLPRIDEFKCSTNVQLGRDAFSGDISNKNSKKGFTHSVFILYILIKIV